MSENKHNAEEQTRVDGRVFYRIDGTVEYIDEGMRELFEVKVDPLGRDYEDLQKNVMAMMAVTIVDIEAMMVRVRRLKRGEPKDCDFDIRRSNGEIRTIHVYYDAVFDGDEVVGFVSNYTDVTDQRPARTRVTEHPNLVALQDLVMALDRGVLLFDEALICTLINDRAKSILGLIRPESRPSTEVWRRSRLPEPVVLDDAVRRCLEDGVPHSAEYLLTRTGGAWRVSLELHKGGRGVVCFVDDAEPRRRLNHVELLAKIGKLGTRELGVESLSQSVMDAIFEFLNVDIVVIGLFEGERLRPVAWQGLLLDAYMVADPLMSHHVKQAIHTGQPTAGDGSEWDGAPLTGSHVVVPLSHGSRVIGTLHLGDIRGDAIEELDDAFLTELGAYIASTVENARRSKAHATERARLSALIQRMPEGVLLFNNRGEILLSNNAAKLVLEIDLKHLNLDRRPYRVLNHEGHVLPRAEWPFFRAARMSAGYIDVPVILAFEDERQKHVNVTVLPIAGNDGPSASFLGMLVDVTERTVQDRRKDEFLSVASHELRSPLTPLTGFLQLVQRQVERGESVDGNLVDRSLDQVRRLSRLIDVLLDMTRIETGRMILNSETVDLCDVVERIAAAWEGHPKGVTVETHFPTGPVIAAIDVGRIDQVLTNLIDNAVKHTAAPNVVVVEVEQDGAVAHIRVADQGCGIPADEIDHVFDRFYQAQRARRDSRSMGLGLYITQQIVQQHGGVIVIESTEGVGTQVQFSLPLETH